MIGQIVNYRYEVLEKIGDGDLFSVYRARDKVLNRLVALKVLSKDLSADREFTAAVVEGYQSVANLAHVSIARVLDADHTSEDCFVAAEYVRGINVKERVRRAGPMAVPLALDIIVPVLEALEYAHSHRVVHGDIRPQDIIVSPDGEVKLTDLGLSWALDRCPGVVEKNPMRSIHYQAPEIAEGSSPSAQSDLYSVGVVLYEMLTSTLPFDGSTAVSIALKKVKETPTSPRSINAAVPKSLSEVVMRAMEVSPEERYQSASAMLADLRVLRDALRTGHAASIQQPLTPPARPAREAEEAVPAVEADPIRKRFVMLLAIFFFTVLVFLGGTMLVIRPSSEIRVPPLQGKTWQEAAEEARDRGLTLIDDGQVASEIYKAGTICAVIPPTGSMVSRDNPVVKVKISSGPSQIAVPEVTGMTEADANETAVREGFSIGTIKEDYSDRVAVNSVVSQDPSAGVKRPPGTTIDLVISLGPKPEPATTTRPEAAPTKQERRFNVAVEVPADAAESQEVLIKVTDDRGDITYHQEMHDPGEKFTVVVPTEGSRARIRVYVGGALVSDATY